MGIDSKRVLWSNLRELAGLAARLPHVDFDELIERAGRQRAELTPFHERAGIDALGAPGGYIERT